MSVAARVSKLFRKLETRRQEQVTDSWAPYRAMLEAVARGEDVDVESVEILLEQMKKTREDFAKDAELIANRIEWHASYSQRPSLTRQAESLQSQLDSLFAERNAFLNRIDARIRDLQETKRSVDHQILSVEIHGTKLANTSFDPTILARRRKLDERRQELFHEETSIRESLSQNSGTVFYNLTKLIDRLAELEADSHRQDHDKIRDTRTYIKKLQAEVDGLRARLNEIARERAKLDAEAKQLQQEAMLP